ncbi:hypothetical protein [Shinella zoogloeoides]|uniref:hypothetical protein n=1 Tax=Shinella zoogloeoides TaxID=352475 RepID=UPI001F583A07|nr:hypothetical protein [Shinella zoogloeoides]
MEDVETERLAALAEAHIEEPEKFAAGSYGCHEALHTASVMADNIGRHLLEHPAILLDAEFYALASKAHSALFDLYQVIGAKHLR